MKSDNVRIPQCDNVRSLNKGNKVYYKYMYGILPVYKDIKGYKMTTARLQKATVNYAKRIINARGKNESMDQLLSALLQIESNNFMHTIDGYVGVGSEIYPADMDRKVSEVAVTIIAIEGNEAWLSDGSVLPMSGRCAFWSKIVGKDNE